MERGGAHIPGYTGYTPGIRETIGLSFSEASRESNERLMSTGDFAPQIPLEGERPDSVRVTRESFPRDALSLATEG